MKPIQVFFYKYGGHQINIYGDKEEAKHLLKVIVKNPDDYEYKGIMDTWPAVKWFKERKK